MNHRFVLLALCLTGLLMAPAAALTLSVSEVENSPPVAENLTLTTYKNVAISGQCAAVDPEGDLITFRLSRKPARGQVELGEDGWFCYTPYENKKGKDTFTYVAVDAVGNVSAEATVKITIEKQTTTVSYADMEGNTAHYAALRLAEEGIFVGPCVSGVSFFCPDEEVSRSEFLAMAMTAAGAEPLTGVNITGFGDDDQIPAWAKGYVSAAVMSGTVRGSADDSGRVVFQGGSSVTAAEAAVVIDRLLVTGDVVSADAFAQDTVPAWAYQSVVNMEAVDVISADLSLSAPLTRGQAAEMLCAMLDVLDSRQSSFWG